MTRRAAKLLNNAPKIGNTHAPKAVFGHAALITGASDAIYRVRLREPLRASRACESHLVMSASGALTALQQLDLKRGDIEGRADLGHNVKDISATIATGQTLASTALGLADNLVSRATDVMLKERRLLVLMARETRLYLRRIWALRMARKAALGALSGSA